MNVISGDLIKLTEKRRFDYIIHGCNTQRNMGAGIAMQIAVSFPLAKKVDMCGCHRLGDISVAYIKQHDVTVVNMYTQIWYGRPNTRYGDADTFTGRYNAIRNGCRKLIALIKKDHPDEDISKIRVGSPLIGCGLAGLKWDIVRSILETELSEVSLTVVEYNT